MNTQDDINAEFQKLFIQVPAEYLPTYINMFYKQIKAIESLGPGHRADDVSKFWQLIDVCKKWYQIKAHQPVDYTPDTNGCGMLRTMISHIRAMRVNLQ